MSPKYFRIVVIIGIGSAYVSKQFAKACRTLGLQPIRIRAYTPRTNGRAEPFIQALCREWAYGACAMLFQTSEERNRWLPRYLAICHRLRQHSALRCRSPQQRLVELLR